MADKIPEIKLGNHIFAVQQGDGKIEVYETLDEIVKDSESDETVYELYTYRQIDISQAA